MRYRGFKKKGNSSKFNGQDDGHFILGPALKVKSHKGFILTVIWIKKSTNMVKRWPWQGTQKKLSRSSEYFSGVQNSYLTSINWKINSKKSGLVARRLYFLEKKKRHKASIFPVLQNLTHIQIRNCLGIVGLQLFLNQYILMYIVIVVDVY